MYEEYKATLKERSRHRVYSELMKVAVQHEHVWKEDLFGPDAKQRVDNTMSASIPEPCLT